MANRLRCAALLLLLVGMRMSAQEVKIGHIDRAQLVMQMPERAAAATKLEGFTKTLEARLKAMGDEYTAKRATAENPPATMSKTERDITLRELQELEQRIMNAQEKAEEDLARMEQELMKPLIDKADEAIRSVAAEQQFTYVLDAGAGVLLSAGSGTDLMPAVKTRLGLK